MYPFTLGAQLICWFKCCFPWFFHDYWTELEPEYSKTFKYVVATPTDHEELDDKEPRRNLKQILWSLMKTIGRPKPADPNLTPDLVQWIHKEELIRILGIPESTEGREPYCWEVAWKCIVIFSTKNKYGRHYYTIVDVCTLQHQDGAESDVKEWHGHLLQVIRSYKPMRIFATDSGPFSVLDREYYMTLSICGFFEIYLEPEKVLQDILLNKVWPLHIVRVKYILDNLIRGDYYSRQNDEVYFNTNKWDVLDSESKKPSKLKFLERTEYKPRKWILKELNSYLKWMKEKQESDDQIPIDNEMYSFRSSQAEYKSKSLDALASIYEKYEKPFTGKLANQGFFFNQWARKGEHLVNLEEKVQIRHKGRKDLLGIKELFTAIKRNKDCRERRSRIVKTTHKVRKTYSEFLWKRETYLYEEETTGLFFPSVLNFRFKEEGDSLLLNSSKDEVDLFLKYRRYYIKWRPLLIFSDDGTLYKNPANELVKTTNEKNEEAKYEAVMEMIRKLPKTRWGVLYTEVGLPMHLQHLNIAAKMKSKHADKTKTGKDFKESSLCKKKREIEANRYWNEREEFNKKWRRHEWVNRSIDRRKYTSGFEWFRFKYPSVFTNVNEKWQEIMSDDYLNEMYLTASEIRDHS